MFFDDPSGYWALLEEATVLDASAFLSHQIDHYLYNAVPEIPYKPHLSSASRAHGFDAQATLAIAQLFSAPIISVSPSAHC